MQTGLQYQHRPAEGRAKPKKKEVVMEYQEFLHRKMHEGADHGFDPVFMPDSLFDFQRELVNWSVRKGRAAMFADCGMGKTPMQLAWAENMARKTGKPTLILTPLAVSGQTIREGEKFGIECERSVDGSRPSMITITNYEKLHHFDSSKFGAVVCDESSILKSFDGSRKQEITDFMRKVPYRLLATATAAPNDYVELGTSSEALGYLGHMDMLNRFFKNDQNNSSTRRLYGEAPKWRFKGHAELPFWRWVTSWARAVRKPSDLGFDDGRFTLPELIETEHLVESESAPEGMLFSLPAENLFEQREERKRTIRERCERVAELVDTGNPAVVWCHMNEEGRMLEQLIPGSVQVSGSDSDEKKEERFLAFSSGEARVMITKPKIGAWGLNWQHCNHVVYFPSHSFEQYYQAVRRCWRFGQTKPVQVDIVMTEGERKVMDNLSRKAEGASTMFEHLVREMNNSLGIQKQNNAINKQELPQWL
jgi:hypothetical protein